MACGEMNRTVKLYYNQNCLSFSYS